MDDREKLQQSPKGSHFPTMVLVAVLLAVTAVSLGLSIFVMTEMFSLRQSGTHFGDLEGLMDDVQTLKKEHQELLQEKKSAEVFSKSAAFQRQRRNDPTTGEEGGEKPNEPSVCIQGPPGRDGRDGRDGATGPVGPGGITAEQLKEVLESLRETSPTSNTKQVTLATNGTLVGGAVYVRWGRTVCSPMSQLVYEGIAAGSLYSHGGGSEKLCLPHDPQWGRYQDGFQSKSYIYGAEYEIYSKDVLSKENNKGQTLHQHDVPCAVCLAVSRPSMMMLPAKKECPKDWMTEYSGYLMAEHNTHQRSSFTCMDEAPEVRPGGVKDQNGALFYSVEAVCGSLPCPGYVDGRELTCTVCTK